MKKPLKKTFLFILLCTALSFASADYTDSIVAAVGAPLATNITHRFVVAGFDIGKPITLYALGRSHNTGLFSSKSVSWSISSGFLKYPTIIAAADNRTGPSFTFTPQLDMSSTSDQSDSGNIRLTFTNELSQIKTYNILIVIIDQTDRTSPNSVAVFNSTDYLPNATNPAVLESLFVNKYDVPGFSITKAPGDTVVELYSLLFSKRAGFAPKYKGLDTAQSWLVRPGVKVAPPYYNLGTSMRYTNRFAPRNDTVEITSSIDSTRRVFIRWSYGTRRFLNLQSRAGSLNDNVSGRIIHKDVSLLDQNITSDTVYACVRDEYDNFILFRDSLNWVIPNMGYSNYISIVPGNPVVINKILNGNMSFSLVALATINGSVLKDTMIIKMSLNTSNELSREKKPESFQLSQNTPNPYNPVTKISYALPDDGYVTLQIFSSSGKLIKTFCSRYMKSGFYTDDINAGELGSGVFLYRLKSGKHELTRTMTIIR